METISFEDLKKAYDDLSYMYDILQEKFQEALKTSQVTKDGYSDLIKLLINENPEFLKKNFSKISLNFTLLSKLNKDEQNVLFKIINKG